MPEEYSIAKDTRDLIADCCVEFIHLISSEANEISEKESKKTISGDHVISALKSLGYEDFIGTLPKLANSVVDEVNLTFVDHVKTEKERVKRKGQVKDSGLTPEEAERIQDEMFASAKARMEQGQSEPNSAVPE
jgi:hypothetical protein